MTKEQRRLDEARTKENEWKKWGPYLSERQWGTVREDYSEDGNAWDYFTHDQARSRAYVRGLRRSVAVRHRRGDAARRSAAHDAERHRVIDLANLCDAVYGGIFALLFMAQALRGWLQGVVQPMMFSVQAKAVGPHRQGSVVGLRQTMNRLAA